MADITQAERRQCNDAALRCFGTAYLFEQRSKPLRTATKLMAFASLAGPLSVGLLAGLFSLSSPLLTGALWTVGALSAVQAIVSLWALSCHWEQNLAYYLESKADNYLLADKLRAHASDTSLSPTRWRAAFDGLTTQGEYRSQSDLRYEICDEEKRMAMRAALREYQRECIGCNKTPNSLESTECQICGSFKWRKWKWLT